MNQQDNLLDDSYLSRYNEESEPIISVNQFMVLCFLSFGLYEMWWMYKAWRYFKEREHLDISPVARAIFSYIFLWSLFDKIKTHAQRAGYTEDFSTAAFGIAFVIVNLLYKLPDPFWIASSFSFLALIPPFKALNYYKQYGSGEQVYEQESFSRNQLIVVILGLIVWALVLIGLNVD
ncbi:MAG: hypothetical protein U0X41_00345 [Chitinophagales bacterium]